jgi:outer membrane protein OmpA-like peptidoglycan-associated protein
MKRSAQIMAKARRLFLWICLSLTAFATMAATATTIRAESECERAEALFQEASITKNPAEGTALLEQAVRLCPGHARAWQNLGIRHENQNNLDAATRAFEKANRLDPNLGTPLASLGDTALKQGRFRAAQRWYDEFLAFLEVEQARGNPRGLSIYRDEYQEKAQRVKLLQEIHLASIDGVVPVAMILRGLKPIPPSGSLKTAFEIQRLSLCIHFDFDSATLKQQGRAQLDELAKAMLNADLLSRSYLIEGHSDLIGEQDYNLALSQQRAKAVWTYLSTRGVAPQRLQTKGLGESRPLRTQGDKAAQQVNRRVEFVQLGEAK